MKNIKIIIQYNGNNYCGWQKQPDSMGIQGNLENAIYEITKQKVKVIGSGRTDSGVHALGQVANFMIDSNISVEKIHDDTTLYYIVFCIMYHRTSTFTF